MAVGVTIFIFLLVLQSCASQKIRSTTGPTIHSTSSPETVKVNKSTSSLSSSATRGGNNTSPGIPHLTQTLSKQTETTSTPAYYVSTTSMPVNTTNTIQSINGTISSNNAITTATMHTTTTAATTTYAPSNGSQSVISSTIIPIAISTENSTVSRTVTEISYSTTHLSEISTEGSNLNSHVSTTITSSTAVSKVTSSTAVSKVTSSTAVSNGTNESGKGNEKEIKNELGYDRDLVIIFGTMLSLMLVASIGYGIFKCKRRQKNRQFIEGGGVIQIETSKF